MNRLLSLLTALVILLGCPAMASEALCYSRLNAPYWHRDAACRFAETSWKASEEIGEETRMVDVAAVEAEGQKPCPGCAAAFPPTFTGDFPEWTHEISPWGIDSGEMIDVDGWPRGVAELPPEVLARWGDASEGLHERFPEGWDKEAQDVIEPSYPDDYAGIFFNACGGYTLLLVDPTPQRVAEWRNLLESEFWVLSARYGWNELRALQHSAESWFMNVDSARMGVGDAAYYHITQIGVDIIDNAVEIGVDPDVFEEGVQRMRRVLASEGVDAPDRIRFFPANYATWL